MTAPHEHPAFTNSVTYTVAITYTVAGGARHGTADRRARKAAEKLVNAAARLADVVAVTATVGSNCDGQVHSPERVRFSAANSGHGSYSQPGKLDRYLDPDHGRALRSLAAANAASKVRDAADRDRRRAVGCNNPIQLFLVDKPRCDCVYCRPDEHYWAAQAGRQHPDSPYVERRCLCGRQVGAGAGRCPSHVDTPLVVLDGDPTALRQLGRLLGQAERSDPADSQPIPRPGRDGADGRDHGEAGWEL